MEPTKVVYDKKDQLEKVTACLLPNENLRVVYDLKGGGTGFIGVTDWRIIFMDKAFLRKKKAVVSISYKQLTAVASEDSGGIVFKSSVLTLMAGPKSWEFEFRNNEKAHTAYQLIIARMLAS